MKKENKKKEETRQDVEKSRVLEGRHVRYGLDISNSGQLDDRTVFPAQSSVLDEEVLLQRVDSEYDITEALGCTFHYRGDSDVYHVNTAGPTYYLKIYRPPVSIDQAEAEALFVADLALHGASVVPAVYRNDGSYASEVIAPEGSRAALLFEEVPVTSFTVSEEASCQLGVAVAQLHTAGDLIDTDYPVLREEHDYLPFARRLAYKEDYAELQDLRRKLKRRLSELLVGRDEQDMGWCHDDLVPSNIRRRSDGTVVFFDFGNARFISRGFELSQVRRILRIKDDLDRSKMLWRTFLDAYAEVRPVPDGMTGNDILLIRDAPQEIGWISGAMASCPLRMGTERFNPEWVREHLVQIRTSVAGILDIKE